jgi:hypothetical protein
MLKGVYTFPDKSQVACYYCPKKSNDDEVYIEWVTNGVKFSGWFPPKGLRYKK